MRLTSWLCQVNFHRVKKKMWEKQGKMIIDKLEIPAELASSGIKIEDATDILLENNLFKPIPTQKFELKIPSPAALPFKKYFYTMNNDVKVSESENQTLALTKTITYQNLPNSLMTTINKYQLPNQDELVQNCILRSLIWDGVQEKLPKIFDETRPCYVFRRRFGISYERKTSNLLFHLSLLCDMLSGRYEKFQRIKILDAFSEVLLKKDRNDLVFQMSCDILLTSEKMLGPFSSPEEVAKTENQEVPNVYPIKPTLDLIKNESNPLQHNELPVPLNANLHTIFFAHKSDDFWFSKELLARAIATCFSFTALTAQKKYGMNVKELPEPICVQCAYLDVKSVNFLVYQLNTLDLDNNNGIKNQAWIDEPDNLYEEISDKNEIINYNSNVFPKMLALYMNGLHCEESLPSMGLNQKVLNDNISA